MGIFHVISSCSCRGTCSCGSGSTGHTAGGIKKSESWRSSPNPPSSELDHIKPSPPNPYVFQVERQVSMAGWTILMVRYPDATNYEGRKILVYHHPIQVVLEQKKLDPHFCDEQGCISPVARFEPTEQGWMMAGWFVMAVVGKKVRL